MKTVSDTFKDARLQTMLPPTIKSIILSEHELDGTLLDEYDLSEYLKGGLPVIDKNIEWALNEFICGDVTLKFYDPDKTIDDILEQSNRLFGLKAKETFDIIDPADVDNISSQNNVEAIAFTPSGKFIFAVAQYDAGEGNSYIRKYPVDRDGNLSAYTASYDLVLNDAYSLLVTSNYVYVASASKAVKIFDHDLTLVGELASIGGSSGQRYFTINSAETYLWTVSYSGHFIGCIDISDKTNPTEVGKVIDESWYPRDVHFYADYLFVLDYTNSKLRIFDASSPAVFPYSELTNIDLVGTSDYIIFDEDHAICYTIGTGGTTVIDVSNPSDPIVTASESGSGYCSSANARGCKIGNKLFLHNDTDNKIYIVDTKNHYQLGIYSNFAITSDGGKDVVFNADNIISWFSREDVKIYTATLRSDWITLFDGLIDIQGKKRFGRNTLALTAHTWEKELEHHNAELVNNITGIYFRYITGITLDSVSGGTVGAKKLKYTYKTILEDSTTVEEFGLTYEDGEEFLFREAGTYSLVGSSGQIITLTIGDVDNLPKKDAEDTLVVNSVIDGGEVGFWYESYTLSELVGFLLNTSNFSITDRDINIDITPLVSTVWQFYYTNNISITSGDIFSCVEDNPPDSSNILAAFGTDVFAVSYDSTTKRITGAVIVDVTATFASATRVDKILRLPNGNALIVCVSGTKDAGSWSDLEGVMEIQNDGTIVHTWDEAFLKQVGGDIATTIAGSSVELINYTKASGEVENRSGFYWLQFRVTLAPDTRYFYVSHVDIDDDPAAIASTTQIYTALASSDCWVAPNVVYHRTWISTPSGGSYHCWFLLANNLGGYIEKVTTAGGANDVEESLTYCTETTINTIRAIRADNSQNRFYLITSKMASNKQYVLKCIATGPGSTNINTDPVNFFVDYPAYLPNINKPTAFEIDGSGIAQNLVSLLWGTGTDNPTIEDIGVGFTGYSYSPHPVCYLSDDEVYLGVSEIGSQPITKCFVCTNISDAIIPIADFSNMNVREALNELAIAFNCTWKRMERDKVRFVSRGSYCDSFELDNDKYKNNWQENKTKPYIGAEIKNPVYEQYQYRYPANFNAEEGEVFKLDNRFAFPINGPLLAKLNGDWFMAIRTEIEIYTRFLIELEEFDKIEWDKYLYDGTPDEQVDCILVGITYDDKTKLTKLRMISIASYPYKQIRFRPNYFA